MTLTFQDDFQSYAFGAKTEHLSKWRGGVVETPHALSIQGEYAGKVSKLVKFEYHNTDVNQPGNPLKADLTGEFVGMNTAQYVGFDVNLLRVTCVSKKEPIFFQYHAGVSSYPPVDLAVGSEDGIQYIVQRVNYFPDGNLNNKQTITKNLVVKPDGWVKVKMFVDFRANSLGRVRTWINDVLEFSYDGTIGHSGFNPYPRVGLYCPNDDQLLSNYAPINKVAFDNFKFGATMAEV